MKKNGEKCELGSVYEKVIVNSFQFGYEYIRYWICELDSKPFNGNIDFNN